MYLCTRMHHKTHQVVSLPCLVVRWQTSEKLEQNLGKEDMHSTRSEVVTSINGWQKITQHQNSNEHSIVSWHFTRRCVTPFPPQALCIDPYVFNHCPWSQSNVNAAIRPWPSDQESRQPARLRHGQFDVDARLNRQPRVAASKPLWV